MKHVSDSPPGPKGLIKAAEKVPNSVAVATAAAAAAFSYQRFVCFTFALFFFLWVPSPSTI